MSATSTILIVDDEPRGRETLEALLTQLGQRLEFAGSGAQALAQASACQPDLVLLDVMMPDMDGYEVCRRLRGDPMLAEVPVILVTALDDRDSRIRGIEAGADDFITKPYDRMELRARVKTVLRLNRYRRITNERRRSVQIADQSPDGFVVVDPAGVLQFANRQARVFLGVPQDRPEHLLGNFRAVAEKIYQCKPDVAWEQWHDPKLQVGAARYLVRPESTISDAFWLRVAVLSRDPLDGEFIHLRDVSGEMKAQMQHLRFEAVVSHKLRTPLNGLVSCLQLALDDLSAEVNPDTAELIRLGLESAQRLEGDINLIVEYTEARKGAPGTSRCRAAEIAPLFRSAATKMALTTVTVETNPVLDAELLPVSATDIGVFARELLGNAARFHPRGRPDVRVTLALKGPGQISLQVGDDGVTLAPNQLLRAFTPYYQGDRAGSGEQPGMGLGLSMVATIVANAGGICQLFNRDPGPGVVAEIVLPVVHE
jgi:CheY-like chemotaxis protein